MTLTDVGLTALETTAEEKEAENAAARRAARRRKQRGDEGDHSAARGGSKWFVLIGLILFTLYSVGPAWWLIVSATKSKEQLYTTNGLWFADFNLFNNLYSLFTYQDGAF